MMSEHQGLPVHGYKSQSEDRVAMVNDNKIAEEQLLRALDEMQQRDREFDLRWVAIARTYFEQGFMAMNRAVFRPGRIKLPTDAP